MLAIKGVYAAREWSFSVYIIFAACILVVFGSVRDFVGAAGYWAMWAGIGICGLLNIIRSYSGVLVEKRFIWVCSAHAIFLSGFIIAAVVNSDTYTWYQLAKLLCIFLIFVVLFINARQLSGRAAYEMCSVLIYLAFTIFILCKYVFTEYYVSFGGRQGSRFAYPGVLWKTVVFFSGLVLVKILYDSKKSACDFLVLGMAIYLLLMDASRTGLLLAVVIYGGLIFSRYKLAALKALAVLLLMALSVYTLTLAVDGLVEGLKGKYPIVFDRFFVTDKTRYRLLSVGLEHAENCFIFGCGFGSAVALKAGEALVVHNAYLAALGELGIVGFAGFTLLMLMPVIFFVGRQTARTGGADLQSKLGLVAMLGGLGYGLSMMLHPMSSELSEWGIWIIMIAWQSAAYSSSDAASVFDKRIF